MNYNTNIGIYKITNIKNNKVYIGQAVDFKARKRGHLSYLRRGVHQNEHLQNSWLKYGEKSFHIELIHTCNRDELDKCEMFYIEKYDSLDREKGYNIREGGSRSPLSEESIEKMRQTIISKKIHSGENNHNAAFSNETAENIILDLLGGMTRCEVRKKYNITGNSLNPLVQNRSYVDVLPHLREKLKNLDKNKFEEKKKEALELYKSGLSQNEISNKLQISRNLLRKLLLENKLNTKVHINKTFKGAEHPLSKAIVQLTLEGEYINKFDTIKEANEKVGVWATGISKCCKGEKETAKGYKWMYLDEYNKLKSAN